MLTRRNNAPLYIPKVGPQALNPNLLKALRQVEVNTQQTEAASMSTGKKVAIGVGIAAVVIGGGFLIVKASKK